MAYSRTDVLHLTGSIPQAMSALCATANSLKWSLDSQDADTASWSVAHGWVDWRIKVCANFLESAGVTTVQITSHSDEFGSQGHVDEAAVALEGPAQASLPVFSHFGSQLPPFTQPAPAPAPPTAWTPGSWSSSVSRPPLSPPPQFTPPPWTQYQPPGLHPWPVIVAGGGQMEEEDEGGPVFGSSGSSSGSSSSGSSSGVTPDIEAQTKIRKGPPTDPVFNDAHATVSQDHKQRAEMWSKVNTEIVRVEARLEKRLGPIEREELVHKLSHLKEWLGTLRDAGPNSSATGI